MRLLPLLFALLLPLAATADEVRLTNGEWSPYLGQNLPHHGVASRIVEEAFALEGTRVRWEFYPWARALRSAERGKSDGSAVWLRSPEREQAFYISDPVVESGYYLFHRKDRPSTGNRSPTSRRCVSAAPSTTTTARPSSRPSATACSRSIA
jgi:polar amino acid transport system substrate-binding protein